MIHGEAGDFLKKHWAVEKEKATTKVEVLTIPGLLPAMELFTEITVCVL